MAGVKQINVALDWEPNANHSGFYIAMHLGFYDQAGIKVSMLIPDDTWSGDPFTKAKEGIVHFALTPSESLIAYMVKNGQANECARFKAIAALLQTDPSAVVTLQDRGLDRLRKLDGKLYASYGARFEKRMIQQLIRNDGGQGMFRNCHVPMSSTLETLLLGKTDAAWIFMNIEGVVAALRGVRLNVFHLTDNGIPYGYTPILSASERFLRKDPETVRAFLMATAKGYAWMATHRAASAAMLTTPPDSDAPELEDEHYRAAAVVQASVAATAPHAVVDGCWGRMSTVRWSLFLNWLGDHGLLPPEESASQAQPSNSAAPGGGMPSIREDPSTLFTNEFLPAHGAVAAAFQLCY